MVKVKRPVINDISLELPAGGVERNESVLHAAARELREETGVTIEDVDRFHESLPIAPSPNRNPNLLNVVNIDISEEEISCKGLHDSEIESVHLFSFAEAAELISIGKIYVAVPVAVISRYLLSLRKPTGKYP